MSIYWALGERAFVGNIQRLQRALEPLNYPKPEWLHVHTVTDFGQVWLKCGSSVAQVWNKCIFFMHFATLCFDTSVLKSSQVQETASPSPDSKTVKHKGVALTPLSRDIHEQGEAAAAS